MEKEFVPYELALRLKLFGFDEHCFGIYDMDTRQFIQNTLCIISDTCTNEAMGCISDVKWITAPTFSQAFRWFRNNHGLCHIIIQNTDKDWTYEVMTIKGITSYYEILDVLDEYEEAELACLEKLIEIVTEKS